MTKDIGLGVVGLRMGRNALCIQRDPTCRLGVRAVCDIDEDVLQERAREYEVGFATTEYHELLARRDVDVVAIYTPDKFHCEQILQALEAGKHVVVTKPMVNSVDEAQQVVEAVRGTGRKLLVGQSRRFEPKVMAAKALLDSGRLGEPVFIQAGYIHDMRPVLARTSWRRDPANKIWLIGAACHPIDLVRWFGGEVVEVSAYANDGESLGDRPGPNNFTLNLVFKNGAIGRVVALFGVIHPPEDLTPFTVCGTKGSLVGTKYSVEVPPHGYESYDLEVPEVEGKGHGGETVRYLRHFAECLEDDRTPMVDATQAARTAAVGQAAMRSLESGRSEKVICDC